MAAQYYDSMIETDEDKPDGQFCKWFTTDDVFANVNCVVSRVHLNPTPSVSSCSDGESRVCIVALLRAAFHPGLYKWIFLTP